MAEENKWLVAHSDPNASLNTLSSCMTLADLNGDGDYKLVLADLGTGQYNMKLKVYRGSVLLTENTVIDLPTAVTTFFMDNVEPRLPAVALASGPCLYVYKNLKPYYKYTVPCLPIDSRETEIWQHAKSGKIDTKILQEALENLRSIISFAELTPRSQRFLMTQADEKDLFVETYKNQVLKRFTVITSMTTMKKSSQQADAVDCFVLGTESGTVSVVDSQAFTVLTEFQLPRGVPCFLNVSGLFDVEFRILVCCRNGFVYSLKRETKNFDKPTIQLDSFAVGMTKIQKTIFIGCMDDSLRGYTLKGKKIWSISMPCAINAVEFFDYKPRNYQAAIVALQNKEIRLYKNTFLVDFFKLDDVVSGLVFGCLSREEGGLVAVTRNGGLHMKLFRRTAKLEEKTGYIGPPLAQSQKLNVPKKTKVFVDQTNRERETAKEMHKNYQKQFFLLRYETAKTYAKMIEQKLTPISIGSSSVESGSLGSNAPLKISVQIHGFGPVFSMKIRLQSASDRPRADLSLCFRYDPKLYKLENCQIILPLILPNMNYCFETKIHALSDKGLTDDVRVLVVTEKLAEPLLTVIVTMPVAEPLLI